MMCLIQSSVLPDVLRLTTRVSQLSPISICLTDSNESGDKILLVSVHSTEYFMMPEKAICSTISPVPLFAVKSFVSRIQTAWSFADANSATKIKYACINREIRTAACTHWEHKLCEVFYVSAQAVLPVALCRPTLTLMATSSLDSP